jgi:hypothetical protein
MNTFQADVLLDISKDYADLQRRRDDSWYGYVDSNIWGAIPFAASSLFRGQNARHSPMLPSIARGLQFSDITKLSESAISDQAKLILGIAQSWWFGRELAYHPIAMHATDQQLDLDEIALAQHYGIPTAYLDLTDDFNVSAFFATCHETKEGWEPVDIGVGIIYRVALKALENPFGHYKPLGPQQLPRPAEQAAWVTELPLCHSFEMWPGVTTLQFEHDSRIGEHFLEMFDGGRSLFPSDPLADVAAEILACREIPADLVDMALNSFIGDPYGLLGEQIPSIRKEIAKLARLVNSRRLLSDQQISALLDDPKWKTKMLSNVTVRWRAIRRVPIEPDDGGAVSD